MFLRAEQLAIPPLGVEPLVLDEDLFLLAMSRALENTLPLLQSKMQSVIHNVFEQFRLTTPPPGRYQQRPLEQSSTPISDPKTQIEIVHSHLWKARSKQVALKSTAVIGGVKKRHRSRRGTYGFLATDTHPKRKVSFQRLVAEIAQDVKVDWRSQSSVVPSLLGSTVSTQVNNTNASFCSVSNIGTLSFVNNGCGAVDSVFVGSIHVGFSVRHDNQGPNSGEKVRECHALHLFDEMLHSNELGNVGRTVPALTSIRDKGGGLAHQPLEYALGVNCAKDNEGVDMKANQLEDDNAISEIGFSSQLIQSNDLLKIVSRAEVPIDGIVITGQTHVNERLTTHEARAICERFGCRIIGGTMSDGCLQVKAIRVSKGRDQNENDVKQDLKIFQSSYFSGGTVVFSDIHELENYFQLDAYNNKSFLGLMPLKELLNRRCGSVKSEWDDLLAGGSSVTLLTKDICNVLLLDKLMAERKCDNTIDIMLWKFETTKYYTDIVAPRHPDFIKDMITSTSKADNAILIIDSTTGGSEADISKDGLACEYTLFTFILGDKQMIYCCNKTSWDAILSCRWLFELQLSSRYLKIYVFGCCLV
ncbi:hypothetical protein ACLB2K_038396 [Fragaria x ananassa]